jgi:hypothetical protein
MANNNRNDDDRRNRGSQEGDGSMSVRVAGQKGGEKGGQRVRELVEEGKQAEGGNRRDDNR